MNESFQLTVQKLHFFYSEVYFMTTNTFRSRLIGIHSVKYGDQVIKVVGHCAFTGRHFRRKKIYFAVQNESRQLGQFLLEGRIASRSCRSWEICCCCSDLNSFRHPENRDQIPFLPSPYSRTTGIYSSYKDHSRVSTTGPF